MAADLERLDSFQLTPHPPVGNDKIGSAGWSRDGPSDVKQFDYYSSSFAIQFAQLVYAKLNVKEDPERSEKYRQRAKDFVKDFIYYFDDEGECLSTIDGGRSCCKGRTLSLVWSQPTVEEREGLLLVALPLCMSR